MIPGRKQNGTFCNSEACSDWKECPDRSHAMLLKDCLEYVLDGAYERFAVLGREAGLADASDTDEKAAQKLLHGIEDLVGICEIPTLSWSGLLHFYVKKC